MEPIRKIEIVEQHVVQIEIDRSLYMDERTIRRKGDFYGLKCVITQVIAEVAASRITERGASRADDLTAVAAMEDRKREGYF